MPAQGLVPRGSAWAHCWDVEPSPGHVPAAGSWERERGGAWRVIINLFMAVAFPMGRGLPPELGQMVFLRASSVSAAAATCQERLDLSSSQEAERERVWRS